MSTQLEIQPEIADKLATLARARGVSVDDLLKEVIDAFEPPSNGKFSLEEFERDMDLLTEGLEHLPTNYSRNLFARRHLFGP